MSVAYTSQIGNRLLAFLPPDVLAALRPKLTPIVLELQQVIYVAGSTIQSVYFPTSGMVSMVANMEDGMQAEVGVIGREGMVGVEIASGVNSSFVESMVQIAGGGWCMDAGDFRQELGASDPFRALLLRYNEALQAQVMQTAACNGRHGLQQRLSRWLLMAHDRVDGDELQLTQEFIAMMLGVHRPSITITAGILQRAGLIRYNNGKVTVLDRTNLEAMACECYRTVRRRSAALLGDAAA